MNYSKKWVVSCVSMVIAIMATIVMIYGAYSPLTAFLFIVGTLLESVDHVVEKEYDVLKSLNILSLIISILCIACITVDSQSADIMTNLPEDFARILFYSTSTIYPIRQIIYTVWIYKRTKEIG
ncbi:MAG: hypothetical protein II133_04885 [Lachnospiraceae bacterium]|nr:hypothetical protein [Lachnospiraceae bacterium]